MIHIGIDLGVSGAIAFIPGSRAPFVVDMPVVRYSATGFVKNAIDPHTLARLLRANTEGIDITPCNVYIERVNAFPGQGVSSMFSLGMSYWGAYSVCAALGLPIQLIEPKEWKGFFKLAKDKALSRGLAQRLFPQCDLGRVKDHNRAEALLIAAYGRHLTENA